MIIKLRDNDMENLIIKKRREIQNNILKRLAEI